MTRIPDLIAAGRTISFELFPPRTEEAERTLEKALPELAELTPSFVSVTYGALGSTRERTRDIVLNIGADNPFPAMPHLTCVGHTRADIVELLEGYRAGGIENVLALGGDPPADGSDPGGEFAHATELVELVKEVGDFSIGVAAHPELHPRSPDRESDRRFLVAKLSMADFAITQFFWDAAHYAQLMHDLAALGCDTPVLPGVMPFINVAGAYRMSAMNGTHVPDDLRARMDAVDGDADAVRDLGVEVATQIAADLLEAGAPGLHLYSMNRSASVRAVLQNLGLR